MSPAGLRDKIHQLDNDSSLLEAIVMNTLCDITSFIDTDPGLSELRTEIASMPRSPSHGLDHLLRVAFWTCRLAGSDVPLRVVIAAALCHDLVDVPKDSPNRPTASQESARKACAVLPRLGFAAHEVLEIAHAIRDHSYSHGTVPSTALGRCLQDADRLDALGAIGIMRNVGTALCLGATFFDANDPWAERRVLDETSFAIDHYFTKLLRLPSTMCTESGRREARRRLKLMNRFLDELAAELVIPRPQTER
jgi:uncharacterized protein